MLSARISEPGYFEEAEYPRALHHAMMTERPLLKAEDEYKLARMVRDYLDTCDPRLYEEAMRKDDHPDRSIRARLYQNWIESGDPDLYDAYRWGREELWLSNTRFVMEIVNKISRSEDVSFDNCLSYGMEGLAKAIDRYEPDKEKGKHKVKCRFTTFAHAWVRQSIQRGIAENENPIRVPMHAFQKRRQIFNAKEAYREKHNGQYNDREIAKEVGLSLPVYNSLQSINTISLNKKLDGPPGDDSGVELGDILEVPKEQSVEEQAFARDRANLVMDLIVSYIEDPIWKRHAYILARRYRLGEPGSNEPERTLDSIGKEINLTRERVRQLLSDFVVYLRKNHPEMREWI